MKMRNLPLLSLFLVLTFGLQAQNTMDKARRDKKNLEFYYKVVAKEHEAFEQVKAPEKWSNESYVFLGIHTYLTMRNNRHVPIVDIRGFERKRIALQDKNAVELFSEFYFDQAETVVIYVTKKDGTEKEIDLKKAIKVETKGSSVYYSRFYSSQHYKLAIPGLEVGDVIDMTTIFNMEEEKRINFASVLTTSVPIVHQNITMDYDYTWNVYQNTINTPYKMNLYKRSGHDFSGNLDSGIDRLELITKDLDALSDEPWQNVYKTEPILKLFFISDRSKFHRDDVKPNSAPLAKNLLTGYLREIDNEYYNYMDAESVYKYTKPVFKNENIKTKKNELVDLIYYYFREKLCFDQHPEKGISNIKGKLTTYEKNFFPNSELNEDFFIYSFHTVLNKYGINSEIVFITPTSIGKFEDVISENDYIVGIYVPDTKKYYWAPSRNKTHTDKPYALYRGGSGKGIDVKTGRKAETKLNDHKIEGSDANVNYEKNVMVVDFVENDEVKIKKSTEYAGYFKDNRFGLQEEFGNQLYEDMLSMFEVEWIRKDQIKYEKDVKTDQNGIYSDFLKRSADNRKKYVENLLKEDDQNITLISYDVPSTGRTFHDPVLRLNAEYKVNDYVKKLGQNYIFEAGKLIGGQMFIEEKYKDNRKNDIFFDVPRKYVNEITFNIPEGYGIDDVTNLNTSVHTEYCSFETKTTLDGKTLKITSEKVYKTLFAPKSAWKDILAVMDAAYTFSQEKVIVKKK